MRTFYLALLIFIPLPVQGFVVADESLGRTSQNILVESYGDKADITITQTLRNNANQALNFNFVLPTRAVNQTPVIYWQRDGQPVEKITSRTQAADLVFNNAKTYNEPAWLRAVDAGFDGWWLAQNLTLAPEQTGVLKVEYQMDLGKVNDFYVGNVWLSDGRETQTLTLNLVRAGSPRIWEANIGTWEAQVADAAWAKQWTTRNYTASQNLVFWASEEGDATLSYKGLNQAYAAEYKALVPTRVQRVVLVLDNSGSVFGARLERLKEGFKTMLEILPPEAEYKVAVAGKSLEWVDTTWRLNDRDNQRETLDFIAEVQAQGKTDWESIVSSLNAARSLKGKPYRLVWLGDFSDIPKPRLTRLANAGWKALMIDFWQSESSFLARWWQRYGGQYVPLFNSGYELVETQKLQSAWRLLNQQWSEDARLENQPGDWFDPIIIHQILNNKALGQTQSLDETSPLVSFLPRWWAQYKIADYLRQHEGLPLNEAQIQAVLSIAHAFGVNVFEFNGKTEFSTLADFLDTVPTDTLWDEILRLSKTPYENGIRYWQSRPFYLVEDRWEPYDWLAYAARPDRPTLELWSAAHQHLFTAYPALLATPMSFGPSTAFCAGQRCASVETEGRADIKFTDTLLWETSPSDHWALGYWADLVWNNVLVEPELNPNDWAEPVSRGQFLVWLQTQLEPQAIMPEIQTDTFKDLNPNQTGAAQALWFYKQDLFKGYSDKTARLQTPMSRIEGLKLIMTAYGLDIRDVLGNYEETMPFSDLVGWTQPWGYEAYLRGLVRGYADNTFRPFQTMTQAEAFKLLVEAPRLLKSRQ